MYDRYGVEESQEGHWEDLLPSQKYSPMLIQHNYITRWYDKLCKGSKSMVDVCLRGLGRLCEMRGTTPSKMFELTRADTKWLYSSLMDLVKDLEG